MKFEGDPLPLLGSVDKSLVSSLGYKLLEDGALKNPNGFNYHTSTLENDSQIPWWCRIDASLRQNNLYTSPYYKEVAPVLEALKSLNLPNLDGSILYSWSISRLSPRTKLGNHTDGILRFRFCDRIIIPLSVNTKSYNYTVVGGKENRVYLEVGGIYRLNNLEIHGAVNDGDTPRDNLLIDMIDPRLWAKFKDHPDLYSLISPNARDFDKEFFRVLISGERLSKGLKYANT